jgi:hypothetical protein
MYTKTQLAFATSLSMIIFVSGCANTASDYTPIVDGPKNAVFDSDLAACKQLAEKREYLNGETKTEALLGAGLGALAGASGNGGDILAGALIGGTLGAAGKAWDARGERKNIVIKCMSGRGHKAVG